MRGIVLAAAAVAAAVSVTSVEAASPGGYSWTGCYLGPTFGIKFGSSKQTYGGHRSGVLDTFLPLGADVTGNYVVDGVLFGGEAGCNYQSGNWVFGVEVDGAWSTADGMSAPNLTAVLAGSNPARTFTTQERWLVTARGRLGFVYNQWLLFVTGGAAWTGLLVNNHAAAVAPVAGWRAPAKVRTSGWIAGLGAERMLVDNLSLKGEVLYAVFSPVFYSDSPAANGCVQCYSMNVHLSEWIFRLGLNYRLIGRQ